MKKLFLFLSAAILSFAACTKETLVENSDYVPCDITFQCELPSTKIALGEKEGSVYKTVWEDGDFLKVYKASDNTELATVTITDGVGSSKGTFAVTSGTLAAGDEVYLSYGEFSIPAVQTQAAAGQFDLITSAKSEVLTLTEGAPAKFTLSHEVALVKVEVSSAAFADLKLTSVMLYSKGTVLAGNASDNVRVNFTEPAVLGGKQEAWIVAVPVATATDFYAVATMEGTGRTVTIPVKFSNKTLTKGRVHVLDLTDLTLESNACPDWYEPVETRDLMGGYAYGAENTYMICSAQSGDTRMNVVVKARGDFSKVSKPAYYGFIMTNDKIDWNRKFLKFTDGHASQDTYDNTKKNFVPSESRTIDANCSFDVLSVDMNTGGATYSVVAIYNADKDLIWSFMFQRYRENDPPCDVHYSDFGVTMLDRALGQANGRANLVSHTESGTLNSYAAYFQWGRKDPFPAMSKADSDAGKQPNMYGKYRPDGDVAENKTTAGDHTSTIENAIKYPYKAFLCSTVNNWMLEMPELWGGVNNTSSWFDPNGIGHKTIYDPCPAGYRVCDGRVINEVVTKASRWERYSVHQREEEYDHPTYFGGSCLAYPIDGQPLDEEAGTNVDYWLYSGYSRAAWGGIYNYFSTLSDQGGLYWTNALCSNGQPGMYQFNFPNGAGKMAMAGGNTGASTLMAVRCQKID